MERKIVSIYQPCYLPPMHYIERVLQSDVFVLLDDVQLNRRVGQTRAHVAGKQGKVTLTVPVAGGNRVMLDEAQFLDNGWEQKHIRTLKGLYGYKEGSKAKEWIDKIEEIMKIGIARDRLFSPFCDDLLRVVLDYLGWQGQYIVASKDKLVSGTKGVDPSTRMLEITKVLGGTDYLCGAKAAEQYLNLDEFEQNGVNVLVQNWKPREYKQKCKTFEPNLSIVDGLIMLSPEELLESLIGGSL